MTALSHTPGSWAVTPFGRTLRFALAAAGLVMSTLLIFTAALVDDVTVWGFLVSGVVLAIVSVRAAHWPSSRRLVALGVAMVAIPTVFQLL